MNSAEWSSKYEMTKKRIQGMRTQVVSYSNEDLRNIIGTLNALDNQLKLMSENPGRYDLFPSEVARRQVILENLKKQMVGSNLKDSGSSLKAGVSGGSSAASPLHSGNDRNSDYNPVSTTDRGLVQRQRDVMKLQDDMLMEIESGVDQLHGKAKAIGEETKMHTRLLDDLDTNVDIATAALQAEARHANEIKEKAQVCYMYICIAVEVIILVLLIIISFK